MYHRERTYNRQPACIVFIQGVVNDKTFEVVSVRNAVDIPKEVHVTIFFDFVSVNCYEHIHYLKRSAGLPANPPSASDGNTQQFHNISISFLKSFFHLIGKLESTL